MGKRLLTKHSGGLLKVYISSNPPITKEDFTRRVKAALLPDSQPEASEAAPSPPTTTNPPPASTGTSSTSSVPLSDESSATSNPVAPPSDQSPAASNPVAQPSNQPSSTPTPQAQSSNQQLFTERAQKLAADKKAKDAAAKAAAAEKAAKAKADKEAYEAGKPVSSNKKANIEYAKLRNERLKKDRDDLAMIRKRVEDDKVERKNREIERKERERALNRDETSIAEFSTAAPGSSSMYGSSKKERSTGATSLTCAIQIRLFDGSTIRNRFPSTATLSTDVRQWISEHHKNQSEKELPYAFKMVLTPLPNRAIETPEESMSLKELGLVPSTTLVLVPAKGVVDAYGGAAGSRGILGWISRLLAAFFGLFGILFGMITGFFGSILPSSAAQTSSTAGSGNTATRADGKERKKRDENREFYNGNNLSFEPRRDEEDEENS